MGHQKHKAYRKNLTSNDPISVNYRIQDEMCRRTTVSPTQKLQLGVFNILMSKVVQAYNWKYEIFLTTCPIPNTLIWFIALVQIIINTPKSYLDQVLHSLWRFIIEVNCHSHLLISTISYWFQILHSISPSLSLPN